MALTDTQQQRLLERPRQAGEQPTAFGELHSGIDFPAAVAPELELSGYAIERVYDYGRLARVQLAFSQNPPQDVPHICGGPGRTDSQLS